MRIKLLRQRDRSSLAKRIKVEGCFFGFNKCGWLSAFFCGFSLRTNEVSEVGGVKPSENNGRVLSFSFGNRSGEDFRNVFIEAVDKI